MAVSKRLRYEILRRDSHTCRYCGATAAEAKLTIDHVIPEALGGTDTPDNLVTACADCNSGKTSVPVDAATVADVQQHHQRWRTAVATAAEENLEQQRFADAFRSAWTAWPEAEELPVGWQRAIDAYRKSGLAPHAWPEIVEISMEKPGISNRFRYCCGVARNRVGELYTKAHKLAGAQDEETSPYHRALVDVWVNEWCGNVSDEEGRAFEASVAAALEEDGDDFSRLAEAAMYSAWVGLTDLKDGADAMDRDGAMRSWVGAWLAAAGEYPADDLYEIVRDQIDKLLNAGTYRGNVKRAASYAGAHTSTRLYFGLGEDDLQATGRNPLLDRLVETWSVAFGRASGRRPIRDELKRFLSTLQTMQLPDCTWGDLYAAAGAAGAYQDPDLSTCLPVGGSVFEAAARL